MQIKSEFKIEGYQNFEKYSIINPEYQNNIFYNSK